MATSRSKHHPERPKAIGPIKSIRLPDETVAKVDQARGTVDFSLYVRNIVEDYLLSPVERAIRDCQEHNAQRGVTPEMLMAAKNKAK